MGRRSGRRIRRPNLVSPLRGLVSQQRLGLLLSEGLFRPLRSLLVTSFFDDLNLGWRKVS
jgi:hypothetical protein